MSIRHIPITEATPEQLSEFARTFLNLDLNGRESPEQILVKIQSAQPGSNLIFVNEVDTEADLAAQEIEGEQPLRDEEAKGKQAGTLGRGDPKAVIFIPIVETEDNSGARDVVVGVNGRAWQLKRGVDLPVPWRVVVALENASATIIRHRNDEGHEGEVAMHDARRFNFNFIERPSQGEIDAWLERTGAEFCA